MDTLKRRRTLEASEVLELLEGDPAASSGVSEQDIDADAAKAALASLVEHWASKPPNGSTMASVAAMRFGLADQFAADELVPFGRAGLEQAHKKKQFVLVRLRYHFVRLGIMDLEDGSDDLGGAAFRGHFIKTHEALQRLYDCLMTNLLTRKCLDPQWAADCPSQLDPYNVVPFDLTKLSTAQAFIFFVLDQLQKRGLRRYRGACFEEIESPPLLIDGGPKRFKTHAWKRLCDINEFVLSCAPKETHFTMWQNMLTGDTKSKTIHHLEHGYETQFPDLDPDRHWHAFPNGLYNTNYKTFFKWGHKRIHAGITACKYHEEMFPEEILGLPWQDVPTPYFHKILDTQLAHVVHIEADASGVPLRNADGEIVSTPEGTRVIEWVYVLIGRLLYEVNEKDCWQVLPFLIGRAGTGKSLILSVASSFFEDADVAVVSNDQQKGFGLETVHDKLMWLVKEVKHDFAIDQAQFQSMITGEEMSITRKNKTALQVVWRSPGILAGNELANWSDNSGSISRRLILFYFNKRVHNSDPHLAARLKQELPSLIHKCCVAYASAVIKYGKSDLWGRDSERAAATTGSKTILPSYFHVNKTSLKQQTHLMENYLCNRDQLHVPGAASGRGMPYESDYEGRPSFKTLANAFFKKQDVKGGFPWAKEDRYRCTFDDFGLEVRRLTVRDVTLGRNRYADHDYPVDTNWIFGVVPKDMLDS